MVNIAVVGMGHWGKNLVRNFYDLGALRIVCDADTSRASVVEAQFPGVEFCHEYETVLANPGIDAVVLATPAVAHFEMARRALESGKDVFVEKPIALKLKEGEDLVSIAARLSRILMVGHILQYHPAVVELKKIIVSGDLGQLQYLYSNRLNIGKIRAEENILWSFAPHDISVMLWLLSEEPCEVYCQGGQYLSQNVVDVTTSEFVFPSGVRAHIFVSWLNPFKEQRLVVVGSKRMAVFDDTAADKLVLYAHRVEWKNRVPTAVKAEGMPVILDSAEPLRSECEHFLKCVAEREKPLTDGKEGLRVLKVLSACQDALERSFPTPSGPPALPTTDSVYYAHPTAIINQPSNIGAGTKIWHFSHIMKRAEIGERCVFGQNCHVAEDVVIGNNVKVQNNVSIYAGTIIEDDVFLGPSCVLTNVTNPRSQINRRSVYQKTILHRGATVGANATIVCGIELGRYCFIGAGAVVTKDVPDYALMVGNPARQVGWMSRHGHTINDPNADGLRFCPESGFRYKEVVPGGLRCLDLDEESPLPTELNVGLKTYEEFKGQSAPKQIPCLPTERF
jgi:UDP-2-acetamido-3-amino-2,3-dideoxy-glucuronate N-acetyltransferase